MRKCRCATCGERFNSVNDKKAHKKKYPDGSCIKAFPTNRYNDPISKLDIGKVHRNNYKEVKMFGRKKKKKVEAPVEEEEEVPEIAEPEEEEEVEEEEEEEEEEPAPVKKKAKPKKEDTELTEDIVRDVLTNYGQRLQRIEYHLRI